ncbi:MAG: chorismate synthase [Halanaerobiales bacterium]
MFEYYTAGESHGPELTAIIKSLPAGLKINTEGINEELQRRQKGYGRGKRMEIERDKVEITSGLRKGKTLGSPLTLKIKNKDWENWKNVMSIEKGCNSKTDKFVSEEVTKPRPGHADLAGGLKYGFSDLRNVLERASARKTAIRTAVGTVCRQFLSNVDIKIFSHVIQIGNIKAEKWKTILAKSGEEFYYDNYFQKVEDSSLRCGNAQKTKEMKNLIDRWAAKGESVGGVFEIIVSGIPPGLGSYTHWDHRLDSRLSAALISIPAIKGVEIGEAFTSAKSPGSKVHDQIYYQKKFGFYRSSNKAGGIEGGVSNGENIILKLAMKPIPTLSSPLNSVDIKSKKEIKAARERSDVCAVPSASIVGEAVTAIVIAQTFSEKFSGDNIGDIINNYNNYMSRIKKFNGG